MLSREENALLTRTGPGTPMGQLMRRYWLPAFLAEELNGPDGPPIRVRLLGEELVAFQDSEGRIGLLGEHCPHRGTSLFFGRNEQCGLRCTYHGWKFDVQGNVLDMPAEPPEADFKRKVRHVAYPCHEAAGLVFAYLGPPGTQPLFPRYEWTDSPTGHTFVVKSLIDNNYLQSLEGEVDSAHTAYLHRTFGAPGLTQQDGAPTYETESTDYGVRLLARRRGPSGQTYLRVTNFVMPFYAFLPGTGRLSSDVGGYDVHFYVPLDDERCWRYDLWFRWHRPVYANEVLRKTRFIDNDYRRIHNRHNDYHIDRAAQREVNYTGIADIVSQDACATETMGPIYDRSQEHLGASDKGVIAVRRYLLDAVRAFERGAPPPHVVTDPAENDFYAIDGLAAYVPADLDTPAQLASAHGARAAQP
ncbi:MAG TPA: Rieske 2Fe-2S domain-containing protein [Chloroflexota bacterium]|nr:Rieske 2Fe-2S domain-containing protein [Chloroflexota bacterium]